MAPAMHLKGDYYEKHTSTDTATGRSAPDPGLKMTIREQVKRGYAELVAVAERGLTAVTPVEAQQLLGEPGVLMIDLRDVREVKRDGKIAGSLHIPRGMLEFWIDPDSPYYRREFDQAESLLLYCNKGWRSALAAQSLRQMGVEAVSHLQGGLDAWQAAGLPLDGMPEAG